MTTLTLPYDFKPRDYQEILWNAVMNPDFKRGLVVWPRRNGKDLVCWNIIITKAMQRVGTYFYIAPYYGQVRQIIWEGSTGAGRRFLDYIPKVLLERKPTKIDMRIRLINGSQIKLLGSDNIDAIMGTNPVGIVFTEMSLHKRGAWDLMRPVLAENGGWALMNGCLAKDMPVLTPEGSIPIQDLRAGDIVCTGVHTTTKVNDIHLNGLAPTITIRTNRGRTITCTYNHKLTRSTGKWVRADELKLGDDIMVVQPAVRQRTPKIRPFFYISGAIMGDGYVERGRVQLCFKKPAKVEAIIPIFQQLLDNGYSLLRMGKRGRQLNPRVILDSGRFWRINSQHLADAYRHYIGTTSNTKTIPPEVMGTTLEGKASFMAGWFDTDGSSRRQSMKISSTSVGALKQGQLLLSELGVYSTISYSPSYYGGLIKGYQMPSSNLYTLHVRGFYARKAIKVLPIRRLSLDKLVGKPKKVAGTHLEKIVALQHNAPEPTYDICIDSPHAYIANGFRTHNTPRGSANEFYEVYIQALRPESAWFLQHINRDDTDVPSLEAIEEDKQSGMPQALINQEYYTSFLSGNVGSYYAAEMEMLREEKRITKLPYDPRLSVYTFWDLGKKDATAVWFVQVHGHELRIIDYYEAIEKSLIDHIKHVKSLKYAYEAHYAPHDIKVEEMSTKISRWDTAAKHGIEFEVVQKLPLMDGIDAVREVLPRCWFDKERTKVGRRALEHYHKSYNVKMEVYSDAPAKSWANHGADAFRYFALVVDEIADLRDWGRPNVIRSIGVRRRTPKIDAHIRVHADDNIYGGRSQRIRRRQTA